MSLFLKKKNNVTHKTEVLYNKLQDCNENRQYFLVVIQVILLFLKKFSLDLKELDSRGFKKRIDDLAEKLSSEKNLKTIRSFFENQKEDILLFIKRQKEYLRSRENEFKDIIELLTKAMASIDEKNQLFNQGILEQTEKIEQITLLDDIKKIKNSLQEKSTQMRKTVRDKQSYDKMEIDRLSNKVKSLNIELEIALAQSLKDGLTGVYNRKAFDNYLKDLLEHSNVMQSHFSMLLLDIDDFKQINDRFGHQIGDRVILAVTEICKEGIRKEDHLARYGGDEFAIVLPGVLLKNSVKKAKRLCKKISRISYSLNDVQDGLNLSFSVSFGVSAYKRGDTVNTITERADKALYAAKHAGKTHVASEKDLKISKTNPETSQPAKNTK